MSIFRRERLLSRTSILLCLSLLFAAIPALSEPRGTGEKIATNYEVLEKISEQAIDELKDNMPHIDENLLILLVKSKGAGTIDDVFTNVLIRKFTDAGLRVTTKVPEGGQDDAFHDYEFNYQMVRFFLKYPDIDRSYWIGSKKVERLAEVGVFAQLTDGATGDIVWVGETQKNYEDVVAYSLLERVEDPQHSFTMPDRKEMKWGKAVETFVVTGIVTGLIYLFFSNQSSNE